MNIVTALLFATMLALSRGYANGPLSREVCREFHVTHTQSEILASDTVDVILRDSQGQEVSCYVPEQKYTVEMKGNWRENTDSRWRMKPNGGIAGFLLRANKGQMSMHHPDDDTYFSHGVCGQSMSHRDILSKSKFHPTYPRLVFNYTATPLTKGIDFRYTAVFDIRHHVADLHKKYDVCSPGCPNADSSNADSSTSIQPREESNDSREHHTETIEPATTTPAPITSCDKNVTETYEIVKQEKHDTTYTCRSKKPIRRLVCEERCSGSRPGSHICCHPKNTYSRRKGFRCVADSDERPNNAPQEYDTSIVVELTSGGCICMDCCNMTTQQDAVSLNN